MKVLIIGCGRVGSLLANQLDEAGHQVTVLDKDQQSFRRLSGKFSGERMIGNGLIEEYVRMAIPDSIDLLFVLTEKDNINLMIGQRAKKNKQAARVIAEVHDSTLAGLYKELGIETACPTGLLVKDLMQVVQESETAGA